MYDKKGYIAFMKSENKSRRTIERYSEYINAWIRFLKKKKKDIDEAAIKDLSEYINSEREKLKPFSHYATSIRIYYRYRKNESMEWAFEKVDYYEPVSLKDIMGIERKYIAVLKNENILTNRDLLDVCLNKEPGGIAKEYGIPPAEFTELVKLAGMARLYYDAGFDTLKKIAETDPGVFREKIRMYIEKKDLVYAPPTPQESLWAVKCAKLRPELIKY
ncbi:MAG: hypothetical protein JW969_13130 [Spirochaetales bacterium]|nr:hypothetical protein [Spirochaetales bacterium]